MLQQAQELARKSLDEGETSDGYRVLADVSNQLLKTRGTFYKLLNHPAARSAALRAVELDPGSPLAHVAAAGYLISAPAIAGGNTRDGVDHAREAVALAGESHFVQFMSSMWLAKGLHELRDNDGAADALRTAASIYPDNWWLAEIAGTLNIDL